MAARAEIVPEAKYVSTAEEPSRRGNNTARTLSSLLKELEYEVPCSFPNWRDYFFSNKPDDIANVKAICGMCHIRSSCPVAGRTIKPLGPDTARDRR